MRSHEISKFRVLTTRLDLKRSTFNFLPRSFEKNLLRKCSKNFYNFLKRDLTHKISRYLKNILLDLVLRSNEDLGRRNGANCALRSHEIFLESTHGWTSMNFLHLKNSYGRFDYYCNLTLTLQNLKFLTRDFIWSKTKGS